MSVTTIVDLESNYLIYRIRLRLDICARNSYEADCLGLHMWQGCILQIPLEYA